MDGIGNFRDFGRYAARDGQRLREGRLFRSAHHSEATDADLERLSRLDIALIADLRKPGERVRNPSRRWQDFGAQVLERSDRADEVEPPHLQFLTEEGLTPAIVGQRMLWFYRESAFEPGHIDIFRRYFAALATTDGAVIVHCMAGKDRTGLLVALTHHLLGVTRDDIMEDYLATNVHYDPEKRLPEVLRNFEEENGRTISPELVLQVLRVAPEMIEGAFDAIAARGGSIDAYLRDTLGVTPAMRERLAARLLV